MWVKGQSGNPAGGPKKKDKFAETLKELADLTCIELTKVNKDGETITELISPKIGDKSVTVHEMIAFKLLQKATDGDLQAIRDYANRAYGTPKESIDVNTNVLPAIQLSPEIMPDKEDGAGK